MGAGTRPGNWVTEVQRFSTRREIDATCDLCTGPITPDHRHLVEPAAHRLLCACRACAGRFAEPSEGRYRLVPRSCERLENFRMSDADWDALGIPIELAFFLPSGPLARIVAFYPGPAGPTESLLDLGAWGALTLANPVLADLRSDVEALLVNRMSQSRDYFRAPIDVCYALAGLIRTKWRGLSGGAEARRAIESFFAEMRTGTGVTCHA